MFQSDHFYMKQALTLARRGKLTVSPNPMVGCVIVKDGEIIGEGWHSYAGGKHAEINALDQAGKQRSYNSNVYVTLEPCCYVGKTGACTATLINANVKKVFVSCLDPNLQVAGKGINILRKHGIVVEVGILKEESQLLNKIFFYFHKYNMPYVIAKWGMSVDGYMRTNISDSNRITNNDSRIKVHNLRNRCDAIVVGANTIKKDDPLLTVRHSEAKIINHPLRVIISSSCNLSIDCKIFNVGVAPTLVFTSVKASMYKLNFFHAQGIKYVVMRTDAKGNFPIMPILKHLANMSITSLLVEGGDRLFYSFFNEKLVNKVEVFVSHVLIRGYAKKLRLFNCCLENLHMGDIRLTSIINN